MPIIKSAVKRMRQTAKRRSRNQVTKRSLRGELKAFTSAKEAKDSKKASQALSAAHGKIDTAVKKGLLKKNTAARMKSRLSAQAKDAGAKVTPSTKKTTSKPAAKKAAPKKTAAKKPAAKKTTAKTTKK